MSLGKYCDGGADVFGAGIRQSSGRRGTQVRRLVLTRRGRNGNNRPTVARVSAAVGASRSIQRPPRMADLRIAARGFWSGPELVRFGVKIRSSVAEEQELAVRRGTEGRVAGQAQTPEVVGASRARSPRVSE